MTSIKSQHLCLERIGSLTIHKHLQRNKWATVDVAFHEILKKNVCVKRSSPEKTKHEATVLQYCQTHNVVSLVDYFHHDGNTCLVTEYCEGGDLLDYGAALWNGNRQVDINIVKRLFRDMSNAVQDVHHRDICHMDISLENFLVSTQDTQVKIKIFDFEMSRFVLQQEPTRACGKSSYMAPEICFPLLQSGAPVGTVYDPRMADIYSLGICLYRLVMGIPLYDGLPNTKNTKFMLLWNQGVSALITRSGAICPGDLVTDLLQKMLNGWEHRITINQVLNHKWFDDDNCLRASSEAVV
jgi:serine/threonine protein kinase